MGISNATQYSTNGLSPSLHTLYLHQRMSWAPITEHYKNGVRNCFYIFDPVPSSFIACIKFQCKKNSWKLLKLNPVVSLFIIHLWLTTFLTKASGEGCATGSLLWLYRLLYVFSSMRIVLKMLAYPHVMVRFQTCSTRFYGSLGGCSEPPEEPSGANY